jgi:lipopolysaccharide transport system ATP-binding protein
MIKQIGPDSSDVLVRVRNVSKKFCRSLKKSLWYGVKDIAHELNPFACSPAKDEMHSRSYKTQLRADEFWAVNDVSFELRRGQCLGLIGHNGAGKTTLLKMLNGLIKPDTGSIEMRGRVGALIALGAGFNPILTGRENIYVNASILGMAKREIDNKVEEIIEFAEIREFIDSPVQSYSSGMQVKLGFSVATVLQPDVLILDEVLAVGDVGFRAKCYNRIATLMNSSAVILVTHSMEHVSQICDQAIVLSSGRLLHGGRPSDCIRIYEDELSSKYRDGIRSGVLSLTNGIDKIEIDCPENVNYGEGLEIVLRLESSEVFADAFIRVCFLSPASMIVGEFNSTWKDVYYHIQAGLNELKVNVPSIQLKPDAYGISIILHDRQGLRNIVWSHLQYTCRVHGDKKGFSTYLICDN